MISPELIRALLHLAAEPLVCGLEFLAAIDAALPPEPDQGDDFAELEDALRP